MRSSSLLLTNVHSTTHFSKIRVHAFNMCIHKKREYGTNLKIRFVADSRINGGSKKQLLRKFQKKKNEQYKKRIVRFSLQFLKPKRLLSRPHFLCLIVSIRKVPFYSLITKQNLASVSTFFIFLDFFDSFFQDVHLK